jgi:hypothetical protein
MIEFVIWMFVLALVPLAFGLTYDLISFAAEFLRVRHSRYHQAAESRALSPSLVPKH